VLLARSPSASDGLQCCQTMPGSPSLSAVWTPPAKIVPTALRKAALPAGQAAAIAQAIVNQGLPTTVRPLLLDRISPRPGEQITVVAADLVASSAHDALFILQGPGGRSQRLVQVSSGVAAGLVTLPTHLEAGTWALAVQDISGVHLMNGRPTGTVLLDLAVFTIAK
jgi:hypothetical protein